MTLCKTRICSVERGIGPIAPQAVTLRLPNALVSGHMGVYYAEKSMLKKSRRKRPDLRGVSRSRQ